MPVCYWEGGHLFQPLGLGVKAAAFRELLKWGLQITLPSVSSAV